MTFGEFHHRFNILAPPENRQSQPVLDEKKVGILLPASYCPYLLLPPPLILLHVLPLPSIPPYLLLPPPLIAATCTSSTFYSPYLLLPPTSHCYHMYYLHLLFPSRPLSQCPHFFTFPSCYPLVDHVHPHTSFH